MIADPARLRGSRQMVSITPDASIAQAIDQMQSAGISQLPVLEHGKPVGAIQEVTLARVLHDHRDPTAVSVGEVMARPLPTLDEHIHLDEAYRLLLAGNTGVLATSDGRVVDIVTRIDLVRYWDETRLTTTSGA